MEAFMFNNNYFVKIIEDSRGPARVVKDHNAVFSRLTTWQLTYPRWIHAELMTHRRFSRCAASSRAIPTKRFREEVGDNPAMPIRWGQQQKGMQAGGDLPPEVTEEAKNVWRAACADALRHHARLEELGLHKQWTNRIIEPWMFITVLVTSTDFNNWFSQRISEHAQPEIAWLATEMYKQYNASTPKELQDGEWHTPYVQDDELDMSLVTRLQVSAARCARVSYLNHGGMRSVEDDEALYSRLMSANPSHWSPLEHVCQAMTTQRWNELICISIENAMVEGTAFDPAEMGNLVGWRQLRKVVGGINEIGLHNTIAPCVEYVPPPHKSL
jgi:thymidylate synthase ThyX